MIRARASAGRPRKEKRDSRLPRRVYLRRARYYFVTPSGKWIGLSDERDGLPGINRSLWELLGPEYIALLPREVLDASSARRAAAIAQQTPAWADPIAIGALYAEARRLTAATGVSYHVDHEVPLRGRLVSGLHVEANLRVILGADNVAKSNAFEP